MIRIATAQSYITDDPRANGKEIRQLMSEAASAKAELIHFPECSISGYAKASIKAWDEVDWVLLKTELELIAAFAKELKIWTVIGSNHRLTAPNRPHNSLYIISSDGDLVTRYDKQWCSQTELDDWYMPGKGNVSFNINDWRFGCSLCIEIQFPELFMAYAAQAIDCMLFSSFSDSAMFRIQAQAYAAVHNYWFSFSVPTQRSNCAAAALIGPNGQIVNSCIRGESSIVVCELNRDAPEWRIALQHAKPWREQVRKDRKFPQSRRVQDERSLNRSVF
jgi:predicted amidohydrolase